MVYNNKDEIYRVIHRLRRERCAYDPYGFSPLYNEYKEPIICDCKYGYHNDISSEQTGCPELRCIEQLLKNITDKEYSDIMGRSNENSQCFYK